MTIEELDKEWGVNQPPKREVAQAEEAKNEEDPTKNDSSEDSSSDTDSSDDSEDGRERKRQKTVTMANDVELLSTATVTVTTGPAKDTLNIEDWSGLDV